MAGGHFPQDEEDDLLYVVTSWGYASASDRVSPGICCELWRQVGVPLIVARSLHRLWSEVRRVIEFAGETAPEVVVSTGSIPPRRPRCDGCHGHDDALSDAPDPQDRGATHVVGLC
eukprot:15431003-Alexandrium_andersonii.AAC.1